MDQEHVEASQKKTFSEVFQQNYLHEENMNLSEWREEGSK